MNTIKLFTALAAALILQGCQKNEQHKPAVAESAGTVDGAGGETSVSRPEEVKLAIEGLRSHLWIASHRASFWLKDKRGAAVYRSPKERAKGEGLEVKYLTYSFLNHPDVIDRIKTVKFLPVNQSCPNKNNNSPYHTTHASADEVTNSICLSISGLSKIPRQRLVVELFALTIHELSHLVGEDEIGAQQLQNEALMLENIYSPGMSESYGILGEIAGLKNTLLSLDLLLMDIELNWKSICFTMGKIDQEILKLEYIVKETMESKFRLPQVEGNSYYDTRWYNSKWELSGFRQCGSNSLNGDIPTPTELQTSVKIMTDLLKQLARFVATYDSPNRRLAIKYPYLVD